MVGGSKWAWKMGRHLWMFPKMKLNTLYPVKTYKKCIYLVLVLKVWGTEIIQRDYPRFSFKSIVMLYYRLFSVFVSFWIYYDYFSVFLYLCVGLLLFCVCLLLFKLLLLVFFVHVYVWICWCACVLYYNLCFLAFKFEMFCDAV